MTTSKGPIGLYGGTFDPPHWGHLLIAETARDALGLPQLFLVPAKIPPHKMDRAVTPVEDRVAMLEAAIEGNPGLAICRWELDQAGPSYTVHTLRHFLAEGWGPIYLLVGGDSIDTLHTWREPEAIRELATLVAVARPGWPAPAGVRVLDLPQLEISSSAVRARVQHGETIRYWVPEQVRHHIEARKLYRSDDRDQASNVLQ